MNRAINRAMTPQVVDPAPAASITSLTSRGCARLDAEAGRVASAHCCAEAPSEPDVRGFHASRLEQALGRAGVQKCCAAVLCGGVPPLAGGVYEMRFGVVRLAVPGRRYGVAYRLSGRA